jgi:hypothetical protein
LRTGKSRPRACAKAQGLPQGKTPGGRPEKPECKREGPLATQTGLLFRMKISTRLWSRLFPAFRAPRLWPFVSLSFPSSST